MGTTVILPSQVYTDTSGSFYELPLLHSEFGHFDGLLNYCLKENTRGLTWKRKLVFDVQLLLNYADVNPHETDSELLFQNFASKLQIGTFNPNSGHDPSGLGWHPRPPHEVQQTITRISDFLDWLGKSDPTVARVNPHRPLTAFDKTVQGYAETYRRKYTLLGHLWKPAAETQRQVRAGRTPTVIGDPPAFPEDRFEELMECGFTVGGRTSYRDQAITLLLDGGGFRESEPMHLFIGDVTRDPTDTSKALVRIHHPSLGIAPPDLLNERGRPILCGRKEYLQRKFGLAPRVDLMSKREAGWKGLVLDENYYMTPFWFQPDYAQRFMEIWDKYMQEVADIPLRLRNHPYAFMNLYREPVGGIYALDKFVKAHGRACERIGLRVAKNLGTTPHGHRHSYGRRLARAGVAPALIKKCMHHTSEQSQETYTGLTAQETMDTLKTAFFNMQQKRSD